MPMRGDEAATFPLRLPAACTMFMHGAGDYAGAIALYAYAYNNLGLTLIAQGRREEGLQQIVVAAGQTSPGLDEARANLRRIGYAGAIPDLTEVPEEAVATEDIAPEVAEVPAEAELSFEVLRELAYEASGQEALDLYARLIAPARAGIPPTRC